MNAVTRFEMLAQRLVEGSFSRLFGGRLEPLDVATQLARAMEESTVAGRPAGAYEVALHPDDLRALREADPQIAAALADYAWRLGRQGGLSLAEPPVIKLLGDPLVRRHEVQVVARPEAETDGPSTQVIRRQNGNGEVLAALREADAFLIVEGRRHVALDKPLMALGRRTDNDIVLEAPEVSRRHAQIRWRFDHFVLYDLSGRGRTKVNGEAVEEHVLVPGDVIGQANVLLIYGDGRDERAPDGRGGDDTIDDTLIGPLYH